MSNTLKLNGFSFPELFSSEGLQRLDARFLTLLAESHPQLHESLLAYRNEAVFTPIEISELLIQCAVVLETFLANLFAIETAVAASQAKTTSNNPISVFKKYFVLRRAKKEMLKAKDLPDFCELNNWLEQELQATSLKAQDKELAIALLGTTYLSDTEAYQAQIEKLVLWCIQALLTPEGQSHVRTWTSFHLPERLDYANLVPLQTNNDKYGRLVGNQEQFRLRDGFKLTDERMNTRQVQDEVNYCIYCHDHDGDFCSKGFPVKKGDPSLGFKKNPLNNILTGCPLEEKISEMNFLKRDGHTLGALAMVMVDNPMCPATGHRICNDCMKSCIYQKQDPVNIPQIETRVLTDVLALPWGVEIYDLLTRWNPLRQKQWVMKPYNSLKVMIAGMGPAGFTLAHHLLMEGFAVVGFDGLKIEPLPEKLIHSPIHSFNALKESLDERLMAGFGGVAEYGITVRWDKNFLKLIYLSLMRRPYFQVFGGVRFGGTVRVEDAWEMGFDHFVVAVGAGLPKALPIPNSLAAGMRQANDFLMALQLGNAAKASSLNNLQIRLPAVVIGGGLTGVDTATELQAYYMVQVEKIKTRYDELVSTFGEAHVQNGLDTASKEILHEFLRHGDAVIKERERARLNNEAPNFIKLAHEWGGVTIAYRRTMQESPAYINNHEELRKALEEGIYYLEGLEPAAVTLNEHGFTESLTCNKRIKDADGNWQTTAETVQLPARSVLVAAGTQPNTAYEFEHHGTFNRLNAQYQHYENTAGELAVAHGVVHCKDTDFGPFTSYQKEDKRVSLVGDTHPVFHGNVVKAIASGMRTYPKILALLHKQIKVGNEDEYKNFAANMSYLFQTKVSTITRVTSDTVQMTIQAPLAAKHFRPGQFYRLQNLESYSLSVNETTLQMEPLPVVAATVDKQQGLLTFIVNENSTPAKLCATLKVDDPITLMGPTGVRAKISKEHETVLIIGSEASLAFVLSYGTALRAQGNRVIFVYCSDENKPLTVMLETAVDETLECTLETLIPKMIESAATLPFADVDRAYVVGDPELLRRFQAARNSALKPVLLKNPKVFGSVYGNMQCMLKGVCAQCLQWQIDPETGLRTKAVFACSWQDQPLELIDIDHIHARLTQNHLHEQLNKLWLNYLFTKFPVKRI